MSAAAARFAQWLAHSSGGLTLRPADKRRAVRDAALAIFGVTALTLLLDGLLFRASLPSGYVAFYTAPLWPRMPIMCLLAISEEVKFRLILMTAMFAAVAALRGRVSPGWAVAAIMLCQLANVGLLVAADPLYGLFRWWLVGAAWGWVYWRHGWFAGASAHGAKHLLMDPLLRLVLS